MAKWRMHTAVILGVVLAGTVSYGAYYFLQDHSAYAPGFSKAKFALVRPGLSEERVVMLLGPPLGEDVGPFGEVWHYKPQSPFALLSDRTRGLIVTFQPDGTVASTMGAPQAMADAKLHAGATATEVLKVVGLPERIDPSVHKTAWYSKQRGDMGRYSVFAVLYDARGIVVATEARWDFD